MSMPSVVQMEPPIAGTWTISRSILAGVMGLVLLNVVFKLAIEYGEIPSMKEYEELVLSTLSSSPMRLLGPMAIDPSGDHIRWTTTGWVPSVIALRILGSWNLVMLVFSSVMVATVYTCSWISMRNATFSNLLGLFMVFGTQFNFAYVNATCFLLYLFVIYIALNLTTLTLLFRTENLTLRNWLAFSGTLILVALCWEMWLDYALFLCVGLTLIFLWMRRHYPERPNPAGKCLAIVSLTVVIYLLARVPFASEFSTAGREAELITSYQQPVLAIEDLLSNVFTFSYISLSNYSPPYVTVSNSLMMYGDADLIAAQNGYHPTHAYLVPQHHHFLWHFYAGGVFAVFLLFTATNLRRAYRERELTPLLITIFCAMVWFGFATHCLIKFRPYLSVPILSYKCSVAICGVSLLFAFLATLAIEKTDAKWKSRWMFGAVCAVLILSALTRPRMQREMLGRVGLGGPPDPIDNIESVFK